MAGEFAVFLPRTKIFNVLPTYCSRVYSICDKKFQNNGWRTRCAQAAGYFIDHSSHFSYVLYGKRERADPQSMAAITWSYSANQPLSMLQLSVTMLDLHQTSYSLLYTVVNAWHFVDHQVISISQSTSKENTSITFMAGLLQLKNKYVYTVTKLESVHPLSNTISDSKLLWDMTSPTNSKHLTSIRLEQNRGNRNRMSLSNSFLNSK